MGKYILGSLVVILGAFMVIKTEWFVENFGYSDWAESKLGGGGTRLMYKILGVLFILISLMAMTGMIGPLVLRFFGRLFGLPQS